MFSKAAIDAGKNTSSPLTEDVRCDEMKQGTLAEQMDAGRLACDTQRSYVDGWHWQGNGDRSACQTIDCYPLAQLNTTLHLYDKQLNLIRALVFLLSVHPLSFTGAAALSVIPLPPCLHHVRTLSVPAYASPYHPSICSEMGGGGGPYAKTCRLSGFLLRQQTSQMCVSLCFTNVNAWPVGTRSASGYMCTLHTIFGDWGCNLYRYAATPPPPNTHRAIHYLEPCPIECNVTSTAPSTVMKKTTLTSMDSMRHND